jgi:hypothetical protein
MGGPVASSEETLGTASVPNKPWRLGDVRVAITVGKTTASDGATTFLFLWEGDVKTTGVSFFFFGGDFPQGIFCVCSAIVL